MIENSKCHAFTDEPFFDQLFIQRNKIKTITGHISTKKELKVIKESKQITKYEFDTKGRLKNQFGSFNTSGIQDTTFITYLYDNRNNLTTKRTNDAYGFYSYRYTFNKENRVTSKTYSREENAGSSRYDFVLGKRYTIVKETYSYVVNDSVIRKSVYNNHNRIYQKIIYHYSNLKLLTSETSQYVISRKKSKTTYKYNDLSQVTEKKVVLDVKTPNEYKLTKYRYDVIGNLEYIDEYTNDKHILHKEVLYDKSTYLIKALLIQDKATKFITIIKFKTTFYE